MRFSFALLTTIGTTVASATDLGTWTVQKYSTESVPSVGVMTRDMTVLYSGQTTPITCHYSFVPRNNPPETSTCSDSTFSYTLGVKPSTNVQPIMMTQTVTIDGAQQTITGNGTLALQCGQGAGSACNGSGSVAATEVVA